MLYLDHISSDPLKVPTITVVKDTNLTVKYQVRNNGANGPLIAGYEVIHFGVPMIGEYVNANTARDGITISPVIPSAQYKITAWALTDSDGRSETPAVEYVIPKAASKTIVNL